MSDLLDGMPPAPTPRGTSTIRGQLIWASVFPLVAFVLLTVLLITSALQNIAQNLILQRNTSLAQVAAAETAETLNGYVNSLQIVGGELKQGSVDLLQHEVELKRFSGGAVLADEHGLGLVATPGHADLVGRDFSGYTSLQAVMGNQQTRFDIIRAGVSGPAVVSFAAPVLTPAGNPGALLAFLPLGSGDTTQWFQPPPSEAAIKVRYLLVDAGGAALAQRGGGLDNPSAAPSAPALPLIRQKIPQSILAETAPSGEQWVISYAPVGNSGWGLVMEEPWQAILSPAYAYEWALAGLLLLGIILSMVMLSVSISRVIRPLAALSEQADALGPGSVFRPMAETGPEELRALFHAFNHMVIRLAEQQAALHQYAEKALMSQEEERQRISHELHDETVQELVGLVQRVDLCRDEMDTDPALARRRLDELSGLAEQALDDLRRISNALRPPILQDLGLVTAVNALCEDLNQQMPTIRCNCKLRGEENRLSPELELAIFRVVQEALSNVRRHSQGTTLVEVLLELKEPVTVASIHDNGPGFPVPDVQTLVREGHLGLAGMYERARLFNGEVTVNSIPGEGTTVTLRLPVPEGMIENSPI